MSQEIILPENEIKDIISLYINEKISTRKLAKRFNTTQHVIMKILRKHSIIARKRKYKLNESYFDRIDTPDKAYFLGWMYADGCNRPEKMRSFLTVRYTDIKILDLFKKYLDSDIKIVYDRNNTVLIISSKKICLSLINQGCIPRKSLILEWPKLVPDNLISHFVRGYFDGDGWLSNKKYKGKKFNHIQFGIISSDSFIESLQEFCLSKLNIDFSIIKCGKNKVLYSGNKKKIEQFFDWMYLDCGDMILDRKYEIYLEIKEYFKKHPLKYNRHT